MVDFDQRGYSDALLDSMWKQRCALLYKAWVQVRYHRREQRFFDLMDKATRALTVGLAASMLAMPLIWLPWIAAAILSVGLLALVFGYADRKQLHQELAEQAVGLVAKIEEVEFAKLAPDVVTRWAALHARFCAKAPPPLKALTLLCEHEQSVADGFPDHVPCAS